MHTHIHTHTPPTYCWLYFSGDLRESFLAFSSYFPAWLAEEASRLIKFTSIYHHLVTPHIGLNAHRELKREDHWL